jgi:hypothetical protein
MVQDKIETKRAEAPIGTDSRARLILVRQAFMCTRNYEGAIDDFFSGQDLKKNA